MSVVVMLGIAVGLAMDATAVSIATDIYLILSFIVQT